MLKKLRRLKIRIILTKRGEEWAALVPMEDMRLLEDLEEARAALAEAKADTTPPIAWDKLKAEMGL